MTSTQPHPSPFPRPSQDEWRQRVEAELGEGRSVESSLVSRTLDGLDVEPLYVADPARPDAASGPRAGGWTVAQSVSHPSPSASNRHALADLENGGTGLSIELGRMARGLEGDHGGTTSRGVEIASLHDLDGLLDGVFLDAVPIVFSTSANGLPLAATFAALCRERSVDPASCRAHLGMDPIAALAGDGELPGDMDDARSELCRLAKHSRMRFDNARSLCVDAGVWHRAGGHAALELGYAAASFVEMLRWLEADGLGPGAAHVEFVWRFDVGQDIAGEIAKLRAARELHARILGSAGVSEAAPLLVHATTSPRSLARRDAWTNLLRLSHATMSAALGGADLVTTLPFDRASTEPGRDSSDLGRRSARNTQLVLERESRLDHVGDPARGAYAIEARTNALARAAWALFQEIEADGGMVAALQSGRIADEVAASRADLEARVAQRKQPIVGVSEFPADRNAKAPPEGAAIDLEALRSAQASRLAARGTVALGPIDDFEHAVDAAARGATLAEIGGALVRGAPLRRAPIGAMREAEVFERLVDAADALPERPSVLLVCLGAAAEHGARATFMTHCFAAGGFDVGQSDPGRTPESAAADWRASGAAFACVVGSDEAYATGGPAVVRALKTAGARRVILAGRPGASEAVLSEAGLDDSLHLGADIAARLASWLCDAGATEVTA